jgi:hypothetical protein
VQEQPPTDCTAAAPLRLPARRDSTSTLAIHSSDPYIHIDVIQAGYIDASNVSTRRIRD